MARDNYPKFRLKNRVAIITGASRGIGRATALVFAREGATVVVNSFKDTSNLKKVVEEIEELGGNALPFEADVGEMNAVKWMVEKALEEFNGVDILVNNAGIWGAVDRCWSSERKTMIAYGE